jgi:hypothetical protein
MLIMPRLLRTIKSFHFLVSLSSTYMQSVSVHCRLLGPRNSIKTYAAFLTSYADLIGSQSYDRKLFSSTSTSSLYVACYNPGAVVVNSGFVGLAPGQKWMVPWKFTKIVPMYSTHLRGSVNRVTRWVCGKIAQNVAKPFLLKLMHNLDWVGR